MSGSKKALSANMEDYLEAIFQIVARKHAVRAKDISARLGVNKSSVTGALHTLASKGLIYYAPYDVITLTPRGRTLAKGVVRRHEVLHDFLVKVLAVDEEEAELSACRMEHALSGRILERLVRFIEFLETCPRGRDRWVERFKRYCECGEGQAPCEMCQYLDLEEAEGDMQN
jgi:DtxR family Mn-dependent transcriptional regulator